MTEFGDFANIDVDKLLTGAQQQFARMEELQSRMGELVGRAQDKDRLVTVEYAGDGLRELEINPRAMRMASADLADLIKTVTQDATRDLQGKTNELMEEIFGKDDNPMKLLNDPEAAMAGAREAEATYNRVLDDVMGELDRIRRRLDL
ncbi:YbaB/EbfC family nucleoid-associated protein [Sphaerisporangium sp. TRM90804]|uniref:YbaB/EbfC family nucleoid-associated protein n=1 Tax=Sphaerisporangium sp. TRM90804 TaxID=3031113 RepID=UPI00244BF857|nr:YbaB/EbfC family nucleoid-associated protein [Sphaerisporangium sp. TRM90804]MDH2425083.1 YbaB/EbfC family nucleoid-associated protein [Sphaerisporangium sp. TRM90804]